MVKFDYNDEDRLVTCTITYKDLEFIGCSLCHPEDEYKRSIGETIAQTRAELNYFRYVRDCEILPELRALKQLHYSINRSKNYNEHSYEARAIRRQMYQKEEDLNYIKSLINEGKDSLYIMFKTMKSLESKVKEG